MVWPLAGPGVLPFEPDDPHFAILHGSLQPSLRDTPEQSYLNDTGGELATTPGEPLDMARTRPAGRHRKWTAAIIISCMLHAAVAMVLLSGYIADPNETTQIEGGDQSGVMVSGNAADQSAAGNIAEQPDVTKVALVSMLDPKPVQTVEAQPAATSETTEPAEDMSAQTPASETVQPVQEPAERPAASERIEPALEEPVQTAALDPLPEILTAMQQPVDDDNVVQQPSPVAPKTEPVEAAKATPVEAAQTVVAKDVPAPKAIEEKPEAEPVEPAKPIKPPKPVKPLKQVQEKPARQIEKPSRKKAQEEPVKAPVKPGRQKQKAGSGGQNAVDAKRGASEGVAEGKARTASQGGKQAAIGNAAVSNYPGKVRSKLVRVFGSTRVRGKGITVVSFTVAENGTLQSARVRSSSGVPEIDKAALAAVRRASPFPSIPAGSGRSTWQFDVPLGVMR
jgi:protein TonB